MALLRGPSWAPLASGTRAERARLAPHGHCPPRPEGTRQVQQSCSSIGTYARGPRTPAALGTLGGMRAGRCRSRGCSGRWGAVSQWHDVQPAWLQRQPEHSGDSPGFWCDALCSQWPHGRCTQPRVGPHVGGRASCRCSLWAGACTCHSRLAAWSAQRRSWAWWIPTAGPLPCLVLPRPCGGRPSQHQSSCAWRRRERSLAQQYARSGLGVCWGWRRFPRHAGSRTLTARRHCSCIPTKCQRVTVGAPPALFNAYAARGTWPWHTRQQPQALPRAWLVGPERTTDLPKARRGPHREPGAGERSTRGAVVLRGAGTVA